MAEPIGRVEELLAELAAMNTAIGFETSCLSCAATLKGAAEQTTRAEKAEAELARVKPMLDAAQAWRDWFPFPDSMFAPENALIAAVDAAKAVGS